MTATSDFFLKRNDTGPALTATIVDNAGTAIDLSPVGTTVKITIRPITGTAPTTYLAATITDAVNGKVSYTPTANDTAAAGLFMVEWHVQVGTGGPLRTFPVDGYQELIIEEDLVTAGGARIVGLGEVKDHLRIPNTDRTRDAALVRLIDGVTPVVEGICGPIVQRLYQNETYDGGRHFISLRHRPVVSVDTVVEYRGPIKYTLTQVPTPDLGTIYSYMFEPPGRIVRRTVGGGITTFPPGLDQVFVTYTAGFQTVPQNVRLGTLDLIRINFQQTEQGGRPLWGTSGGDASDSLSGVTMLGFFVPNRVRELLAPNKRHPSVA